MYIEDRLFSESEQEVYYSAILDEEEMRLFSSFKNIFKRQTKSQKIKEKTKNILSSLSGKISDSSKKIKNGKVVQGIKKELGKLKTDILHPSKNRLPKIIKPDYSIGKKELAAAGLGALGIGAIGALANRKKEDED